MEMKVAFRVDASLQMGSGHVMRCLTLADALQSCGAQCLFVCRPHVGHLLEKIRQKHLCVELPTVQNNSNKFDECDDSTYANWLGCTWEIDAAQTCEVLRDYHADWLVVDHYALDSRWEQVVQSGCRKILVIDDLANRPHVGELLLDQTLGRSLADYRGLVTSECFVMAGPNFALLRNEFATARLESLMRRRDGFVGNLLVSMGGADSRNVTSSVLRALGQCSLNHQCAVNVVLGPQNPWHKEVMELTYSLPFATRVLVNCTNMANLMVAADLAIGAAGATSWERCCVGLPTILLTLAENQVPSANALSEAGAALYLKDWRELETKLPKAIDTLLLPGVVQAMSRASAALCDGFGARRVVDQILGIKA